MLSAKLAFIVQPIMEQISAGNDYLQRLQSQVILPFGFIVGIHFFEGVIQYFGKFIQVIWLFGKFNQPLMAAFGMFVHEDGSGGIVYNLCSRGSTGFA